MSLLRMSLSGAVMILAVVIIRALAIHKLPKRTFSLMWDIVLVRLLVPYSLPSVFSLYSLLSRLAPADKTVPGGAALQAAPDPPSAAPALPNIQNIPNVPAVPAPAAAAAPGFPWEAIWLAVSLILAAFFTAAYLRSCKAFRSAAPVDTEFTRSWLSQNRIRRPISIRQSGAASSPLTYGILRPIILLPDTAGWDDCLPFILAHELIHIRRFDALRKLLLSAALCVHWWNPAVWVMLALANRDIELSCDEAVLRQFGAQSKSAYAMALIHMEETKTINGPFCNNFSKNAIEERIVAIMKSKTTTITALLSAAILVAGVTTAFATSPQELPEEKRPDSTGLSAPESGEWEVMSYTDPEDGKTYYSKDGGETWTPMTVKEFEDWLGTSGVEWWTADEYAVWLENEKKMLQSAIGSQGWTNSKGWFTWDEEMVNETIAQYEGTLELIKSGTKISKPAADGDTMYFSFLPDGEPDSAVSGVANTTTGSTLSYSSGVSQDYSQSGYGNGYCHSSSHHSGHHSGCHH